MTASDGRGHALSNGVVAALFAVTDRKSVV